MLKPFKIADRHIGPDQPPYIIAEMSANHNGRLDNAYRLLDAAKKAGADAVKMQTYRPDTMTLDSDRADFQITEGLWKGYSLYNLYAWAHTPWEWHKPLFDQARKLGITLFSSPFDTTAVDLLEDLGAPAYKIASFEAVDLPLIEYVASTGKPMIISTGMADLTEIEEAAACARQGGCQEIALLHCVSGYPTPPEQSNIRTIPDLRERFGAIVGLSDHTLGNTAALASVALGASIIEKHFTFRREDGGPDAAFSLEPDELEALCRESRIAWEALGRAGYDPKPAEEANKIFRRSIYAVQDIAPGEQLTPDNVRIIRPGHGLAPKHLKTVLGKRTNRAIQRGEALSWQVLE